MAARRDDDRVILGQVGAPHGVRGWIRVTSSTRPPEAILDFGVWWLGAPERAQAYTVDESRVAGERIVARLRGVGTREAAAELRHAPIAVPRSQLPPAGSDEWYWADLIGLRVRTPAGVDLGRVDHLLETGANDVLVITGERERLVPWIPDEVIVRVDLAAGELVVDWDPDF